MSHRPRLPVYFGVNQPPPIDPPRHVYLHVPFCRRRCSYCDFAIAVRRTVPVDEYIALVDAEVERRAVDIAGERAGEAWTLETLYLGGGTPSLLGADGVRRLMDRLRHRFRLDGAEVTLEANPDDILPEAARAWVQAGINRVSIGAQSFDDRALAWMHRTHDAARIALGVDAARAAGIENLSLDLIFALPDGVRRSWADDLDRALALRPTHLSLYGLTIEPATPLARWRDRASVAEAPDERYAGEFLEAHARLREAGFEHYEVSNFARPGRRARHNSSYWRHVPYAGFGPAAHSFDGGRRRWNTREYAAWAAEVRAGRDPVSGTEVLSEDDLLAERIYLGLRTLDGVDLASVGLAAGSLPDRVERWIEAGWGTVDAGRLRLTAAGWLRLDALAVDLTVTSSKS